MYSGIEFNGKHSFKDFDLTISEKHIGDPSKVKTIEQIPWSNTEYDFSSLLGVQPYSERILTYVFNVLGPNKTKEEFNNIKTAVTNWLSGGIGKGILKDDDFPYFYFKAEMVEASDYEKYQKFGGTLSVTFNAYSFKIHELEEGNDIWDSFNFLLDYAQDISFTISGSKKVDIMNPGISVAYPRIVSSTTMKITKGSTTYNIPAGSINSYDFGLSPGENELMIIGNGTISFHFHKELI